MSYVFEFDPIHRVLLCSFSGPCTDPVLREYYRALASYCRQTDPLAAIMDLTGVTSIDFSAATVQGLAFSDPAFPDPSRPRIIVAPSDYAYGMSRMFQIVGE